MCPSNQWLDSKSSIVFNAYYCSGADEAKPVGSGEISGKPTEAVKELYDKILLSIKEKRSAPPNGLLWSLISNCQKKDDIKFLFSVLQQLRLFRMSYLRIPDNFNDNLCLEVTKACTRVGAIEFGKKTLHKHNVYGLSPITGSANTLLSYAKSRKKLKLLADVMELLKQNDVQLQPSIADHVFSICSEADNWKLLSKYSETFIKAGVKLRKTTFGTWMEFAARRGDTEYLWKIEKMRSELYKAHTLKSGLSCSKGLLLERKPEEAAAVIQVLNQILPDSTKANIITELEKLVSEWPSDVIKHHKKDKRKELAAALTTDVPTMVSLLLSMGVETSASMKNVKIPEEALLS